MIVLINKNILLLCDSEDIIPLWREDNVEVREIFVTETSFLTESSKNLFEAM
jgi:Zn ribbon nucleic-acid-binding protein